jgi:hypothetical protein
MAGQESMRTGEPSPATESAGTQSFLNGRDEPSGFTISVPPP